MSNEVEKKEETKLTIKEFLNKGIAEKKLQELLGKNSAAFATSILQIVNSNELLKKAHPMSIFNAACMAASLNLPINANLGFAYIVPYNNKKTGITEAQFQLGYKGFIQLAQRSGQFKIISASEVKEGQLVSEDPLKGYVFNWSIKSERNIGYVAYFQLLNGFEAYLYMSIEQVKEHAKKYSQSFKKGYGIWVDNFDAMAKKTVIKLLLAQKAPMSIDMQQAVLADQSVIKDAKDGQFEYIDTDDERDLPIQAAMLNVPDGYQAYEDEHLPILREASMSGRLALNTAFQAIPASNFKVTLWQAHSTSLNEAAGSSE